MQVGSGSMVGVNMIMEHAKENHPSRIASIGISTGWEVTGRWEISNVEGILDEFLCNKLNSFYVVIMPVIFHSYYFSASENHLILLLV